MNIRSVRHRGLRRLIQQGDNREIRPDMVKRIQHVLTILMAAPSLQSVRGYPGWRIHELSGNRKGTWSISVTGNWRITFELVDNEIGNLDLEDYH
jgi:proteic killer suppression protein